MVAALSALALVVAAVALYLIATRPAAATADTSCRAVAWDAVPTSDSLPEGWTINGSGFYTDGYGASFSGPTPSGTTAAPPGITVRVSCYGADGHLVVKRSHDSDLAVGGTDVPFADIGDEALATQDSIGTTTSVYIRRGPLVASIAAQGVLPDDLVAAAGAIDDAMVAAEARPAPNASAGPSASDGQVEPVQSDGLASEVPEPTPTEAHAFAALEALLPKTIDGTDLSSQSTTGTDALGSDPSSEPLIKWLATKGKTPGDLQIAEAYDPTLTIDADITALRLDGTTAAVLRQELMHTWLGADASGITTTNKTIGGKAVMVIDYGDEGALDYVFEHGDTVVILSTSDPALAARVIAGFK